MSHVKCSGGPLHGQFMTVRHDRFAAPQQPRDQRIMEWGCHPPTIEDLSFETVTYMVERFRERRGTAYREIKIAVVEGHKNLMRSEEWEIERDIHKERWRPIKVPGFFKEFDSWFNWCAYRHTLDSKYLADEFRKPRMS